MEGTVLGFNAGEGVIKTADGTRFTFSRGDWKSPREPVAGHRVDFVPEDGKATDIYLLSPTAGAVYSTVDSIGKSEKTMPTVVYVCYIAAFLWGVTMIIGVVVAYVCRGSAVGTWYQSHFDYQISIFWKSLAWFLISIPLVFAYGLGAITMLATYVWVIYKIIKGWRALSEGRGIDLKASRDHG